MTKQQIRDAKLKYQRECADTAYHAHKAMQTILTREAKGKTIH